MGKLAVVTGGTRGIGAAIAVALQKAGYDVAANYVSSDTAAKSFSESTGIAIFKWDVSDAAACSKGVKAVCKHFKKDVDVLINNAGIVRDAMFHKMDIDAWNAVIRTNLDSCFCMCHAVVGGMRERGFGRIVNISSVNALAGQLGQTNYASAKAGVIGFSKSLALENARNGVTVNVVAPGYITTDMTAEVPAHVLESLKKHIPVGRLGRPEEIARAVVFLASDDAGFITGETLSVNGGHYMS